MDEPSDLLYRLIVHELTHVFQFDIIPTSLVRRNMPLWVSEGMADYMTGIWRPLDLMTVRDAAVADIVPKMSDLEGYGNFTNPRLIYNLGHAAFDFIEIREDVSRGSPARERRRHERRRFLRGHAAGVHRRAWRSAVHLLGLVGVAVRDFQQAQFGRTLFNNGTLVPLGIAFVQETTIFREFGPLAGSTMRLAYEAAPKIGSTLSRQMLDADARKYFRIAGSGLLALRARGFTSWGDNPDFLYFGGNSEMRGYDYLSFVGQDAFFLNAELRFPLIDAMATPIGILGGIRGTFFANLGGASFEARGSSSGHGIRLSSSRSWARNSIP